MELRERRWSLLCLPRGTGYLMPSVEGGFLILDVVFQFPDILIFLMHVSI